MSFPRTVGTSSLLGRPRSLFARILIYALETEGLVLAVMVLLVRGPDIFYHFVDWDEASMMAQAWSMTRGELLYRDLPQIHGVLNMAIFVPFFLFFGADATPHAIKALNLALVLAGAFLVRGIARQWLGNRPSAFLAAMLFVFLLGRRWAISSHGEFYTIFPTLAAVALVFFPPPRLPFPLRMFTAGVLFATAFFIKQTAAFDAVALSLAWVAVSCEDRRKKVEGIAWLSLGGFAIGAAVALYFVAHGGAAEWIDSTFMRVLHYTGASDGRRAALPLMLVQAVADKLAPAALSWAAGVAFFLLSDGHRSKDGRFFLVLTVWLAGSATAILLIGRFYDHYLLQLIPALSLAGVYIASRMPPVSCRAVVLGTGALLLTHAAMSAGLQIRALRAEGWTPPNVRKSRAIAEAVRSYTRDDDRIFIYRANNLDVFFLSGRLPAAGITMFIDMAEEHSGDVETAARKRRSLAERPPALILVGTTHWRFPITDAFFQSLLGQYYERVSEVYDVVVYRRR